MDFKELGLSENILRAVEESGYTTPTDIQAKAIPEVLAGRDVLGIAQTGTGKTASFTLPMMTLLERGRARARMPRSLILEPTRELAAQVADNFTKYGTYSQLNMALLIGGVSFNDQVQKLERGVDVLIATPGRLLDHFERGGILLNGVQIFVIDEADRMLDMGFIPDIEKLGKMLPFTRQSLLLSATMPKPIEKLSEAFLHNPVRIEVARAASTASTITQLCQFVDARKKKDALLSYLTSREVTNAIVFCNRKRDIGSIDQFLQKNGQNSGSLHGDIEQRIRIETLNKFKQGEINVLVASDVAARGLDISSVGHVVNYDVPHNAEDYVHRIGRTGRAGRLGEAVTLVSSSDQENWGKVEELIQQKIPELDASTKEQTGVKKTTDEGEAQPKAQKRTTKKEAPADANNEVLSKPAEQERKKSGRKNNGAGLGDMAEDMRPFGQTDQVPAFLKTEP
ncbi:MAG: ATP-dependent helicase [SAR116 cluster bacterium]|nr:DEAD/DEAH box helicase [Paracoccaceae bacterium]RCL79449.1 MAG: ATP-dependent helicase [SAR116 cluster bacterium]RPH14413.1 MAG: DEAD/DEAH box helicase [Alphaproteobacteria bacterium TMED150]|tara:strand:+ start:1375 stop:2736 length:1362 start_codon:yes stop_codon:yes gene_type:complete